MSNQEDTAKHVCPYTVKNTIAGVVKGGWSGISQLWLVEVEAKAWEGGRQAPRWLTGGRKALGREILVLSARVAGVELTPEMTCHCKLYKCEVVVR